MRESQREIEKREKSGEEEDFWPNGFEGREGLHEREPSRPGGSLQRREETALGSVCS